MNTPLNTAGFTLIEVLIAISILGIIGSIGYLSLGSATKEAALNSSHATVITAIESARSNAMRGADERSVEIGADGKSIIIGSGATVPLSPTVTITTDSATNTIEFNRISGAMTSVATTTLTLTGSAGTTTITITPEGYVE
jgi:prepilin-type N-terminal cleavage/methylation domain-containing protein